MKNVHIKRLAGNAITPYVPDLAALRIKVFRDYPYLYEGDIEYEKKYLTKYADSENSLLILVLDGKKIVGASSAIPLKDESGEVKKPFVSAGFDINKVFYLGESVLLSEYRGRQIGRLFFAERENAAREHGYNITAFCAIDRNHDHPKRPKEWYALDNFWTSIGYEKRPELETLFSWQDTGDNVVSEKPMIFWLKQL